MSTAMVNALFLLLLACCLTWLWMRRIHQAGIETLPAQETQAEIQRRYRRKGYYRLGVFVCCLAAAMALFSGWGRITSIVLVICAGFCQYGVVRQRTGTYLSQTLQQKYLLPTVSSAVGDPQNTCEQAGKNDVANALVK